MIASLATFATVWVIAIPVTDCVPPPSVPEEAKRWKFKVRAG